MTSRSSTRKRSSLVEDKSSVSTSDRSKHDDQVFVKLGAPIGKTPWKSQQPDSRSRPSSEPTSSTVTKCKESSAREPLHSIDKVQVTLSKESNLLTTTSSNEPSMFVEVTGQHFEFLRGLLKEKAKFPEGIDKIMCDKRSAQQVERLYNLHKNKEDKENVSSTTSKTSTKSHGPTKKAHRKRKHSQSFTIKSPSAVSTASEAGSSKCPRSSASQSVSGLNESVVPFDGIPAKYGYGCTEPFLDSSPASARGEGDEDSETDKEALEAMYENFGQGATRVKMFQPAALPVNTHLKKVKVEGDYVQPSIVKLEK